MTASIMDSFLEQYLEPQDFAVTPEKLEELKEKVPRAGPKYRLGMYFETIHDLRYFDEVPEDVYSSCWETDTEIDDELGNLIFHKVTGDSASVICIDEAMDILALREQQQQQQQQLVKGESSSPELVQDKEDLALDHPLERSEGSKRSSASRHSHHSGSDGTYEGPPQPPLSRAPSVSQEHIYESLDDCRENYHAHLEGIYVSKASDGSRDSTDSTAKPVSNLSDDILTTAKGATRSPTQKVKQRSASVPQPPEAFRTYHRRKLSETDFQQRKKKQPYPERSEKVAPKSYPPPTRGYNSFPDGVPRDYAEYMALPSAPPSPKKRAPPEHHKKLPPCPKLVIKHKGKTFVIPVIDKKTQQKLEKSRQEQQSRLRDREASVYTPLPKHSTLNTLTRSHSTTFTSMCQTAPRRHASPPKLESSDRASPHRRKSKVSQSVTHYGVV